jgi:hypothetical protein
VENARRLQSASESSMIASAAAATAVCTLKTSVPYAFAMVIIARLNGLCPSRTHGVTLETQAARHPQEHRPSLQANLF